MNILKYAVITLFCFCAFYLSACSSRKEGVLETFDKKLNTLQNGQTSIEEARILLGTPDVILTRGKAATWVYRDKEDTKEQTYQLPKVSQRQNTVLTFDSSGILKEYQQFNAERLKIEETESTQSLSNLESPRTEDPKPARLTITP